MTAKPLYEVSNPAGFWKCTHSTFSDFVVGENYPCLPGNNGGHRVYSKLHQKVWSPYWEMHKARFCYSADKLDFVFVRPFKGDEEAHFTYVRDNTPPPTYPEISGPLEFADDTQAYVPPLRQPLLTREHLKNTAIFLAGAATASLVFFFL